MRRSALQMPVFHVRAWAPGLWLGVVILMFASLAYGTAQSSSGPSDMGDADYGAELSPDDDQGGAPSATGAAGQLPGESPDEEPEVDYFLAVSGWEFQAAPQGGLTSSRAGPEPRVGAFQFLKRPPKYKWLSGCV